MSNARPDAVDARAAILRPLGVPIPTEQEDPLGFPGYAERLGALPPDVDASGVDVGLMTLGSEDVVVARSRFEVLAGSMGRGHGAAVRTAMDVAIERCLPFVALVASGGARVQEGLHALLQMARVADGVRILREAGVPMLTHLGHPSTGGVLASYASLADVILADPTATVGFAGPRVVEQVTGSTVGPESHTGRSGFASGLVDELAPHEESVARLGRWIALLHPARRHGPLPSLRDDEPGTVVLDADEVVRRSRAAGRPSARDLVRQVFDDVVELSGDRAGSVDPVAVAAVARLGGRTVVVVGTDRAAIGQHGRAGMPGPAAYRTIRRALSLAARHDLPVVSLIDTPGADPSPSSEAAGLAGAIAETYVAILGLATPTVGVVVGEGGSGGAFALGATDRLLIQDDAFLTVIAPESAATILHRDAARAASITDHLRLRAHDLLAHGHVDAVLPGPTTAGADTAALALRDRIAREVAELDALPDRVARRRTRYGG